MEWLKKRNDAKFYTQIWIAAVQWIVYICASFNHQELIYFFSGLSNLMRLSLYEENWLIVQAAILLTAQWETPAV